MNQTKKRAVALITLLAIGTTIIVTQNQPASNLVALANPSFEDGTHDKSLRCQYESACALVEIDNIKSPVGWLAWFIHEEPCAKPYVTGQPEARVIGPIPDPMRIFDGVSAVEFFTFWRCHRGGLLQQVQVEPGQWYQASAMVHSWYSQCSTEPHGPRLEGDCVTPIHWAHDWFRVGLDPTGGTDPRAPSVVWSATSEVYGGYGARLHSAPVKAMGNWMTVFFESRTTHTLKHENVYFDDTALELVQVYWFPIILKGAKR